MGQIRNYQTDNLRKGTEPITYEVFDYEGTHKLTLSEDILFQAPKDLQPLNKDLIKLYERPTKKVEFITDLFGNYIVNENAHFLYDNRHWSLGSTSQTNATGNTGNKVEIITDDDQAAKAVSGNKYFHSDIVVTYSTPVQMLANDRQYAQIKTRQDVQLEFDYYIESTGSDETWQLAVKFWVQETYASGAPDKSYDFEAEEWVDYAANKYKDFTTTTVNAWGKASINVKGYTPSSDSFKTVYAQMAICFPNLKDDGGDGGFENIYIDNVRLSETFEVPKTMISRRKQFDHAGKTYTGEYKSEGNVLSNEAQSTEYFIGKIDGYFRRNRDGVDKTLEQIITHEIMNDNRQFMAKYEGTFYGTRKEHLGLHNKIWIDFGESVLQEPVSCYLDAMTYNVKAAEYNIRMHVPNQDDDTPSTYNVYVE